MIHLSIEQLTKSFSETPLFNGITFGLNAGDKVAIVGINGCGKSTLLKIIGGIETADSGVVTFQRDLKVGYLDQSPTFNGHGTVLDQVLAGDDPITTTVRNYEHLLKTQGEGSEFEQVLEKMDALNAWDIEAQVAQILGKLGIHNIEQPISELSGGQKKRVALAKVLIDKPDLLILDEPTNHLDLESIEWLEGYLAKQNTTLLLVTHDRYFLEAVTNKIIELDNKQLYKYNGNYNYYLEKKSDREERESAEIDKAKNLLRKELEWMRRQPKARGTKAKYRIDAFQDLKTKASSKAEEKSLDLDIVVARQGKSILELKNISKSYGSKCLIDRFSYVFKKGDKIGIVGKNGVGKSTLLNLICDKAELDSGEIEKGRNTKIGYYTQQDLQFKSDQKVIDLVRDIAEYITMGDGRKASASQFLQHFGFTPTQQYDFVAKLSGGEKRRLQLLKVLIDSPNFLILDEPTNDLDLITLAVLEDYLDSFPGCLIIVSHDRYFMDRLVDQIFAFEGSGIINPVPGNFTDYRDIKKAAVVLPTKSKAAPEKKGAKEKNKLSFNEMKEFEALESKIATLEDLKKSIIEKLNKEGASHEDLANWSQEIEKIDKELEAKEMRWLVLSEFA